MNIRTRMNKSWSWGLVCLVVVFVTLPGCGDGRPKRVPVSGTVLIDGKPLAHGFVRFHPQGGRPATSELDDQGHFILTCFEKNDGVTPGNHPVSVTAFEAVGSKSMRWHAPKKYMSPKTSGLTQNIEGPTDSVKIELTWAGGKPFVERIEE